MNKLGTYTITYTAIDAAGNRANTQRTVSVVDKTAPTISILGDNPFKMVINDDFDTIDPGVKVTDNYWSEESIKVVKDVTQLIPSVPGTYFVYYQATDSSGNRSTSRFRQVDVGFRTGLLDASKQLISFKIFPNPSNGKVRIESDESINTIKVYEINGRLYKTLEDIGTAVDLEIKDSGLYLIMIETSKGTNSQRLLIQK
jgi:hypothetical protein